MVHRHRYWGGSGGGRPPTIQLGGGTRVSFRPPTFAMELNFNFEVYVNVYR